MTLLPGFGQDYPSAGLRAGSPSVLAAPPAAAASPTSETRETGLAALSFGWMRRLIQGTVRERTRQKKETSVSVGLSRKG